MYKRGTPLLIPIPSEIILVVFPFPWLARFALAVYAGQGRSLTGDTCMVRLLHEIFLTLVFLVGVAIGSTIALVNPSLMEDTAFRVACILVVLCLPAGRAVLRWGLSPQRKGTVICGGAFYARREACTLEPRYQCCSCARPLCEVHAARGYSDSHIYCLDCLTPNAPAGERIAQ